jgi:hypothetical protein
VASKPSGMYDTIIRLPGIREVRHVRRKTRAALRSERNSTRKKL